MSDVIVNEGRRTNDEGVVVGGWFVYENGDTAEWYCPYIPLSILIPKEIVVGFLCEPAPDYLAITREVEGLG